MVIIDGKKGNRIVIDDHISLTIVENENGELVIAIDSPNEIDIVKGEDFEKNHKKIAKKD